MRSNNSACSRESAARCNSTSLASLSSRLVASSACRSARSTHQRDTTHIPLAIDGSAAAATTHHGPPAISAIQGPVLTAVSFGRIRRSTEYTFRPHHPAYTATEGDQGVATHTPSVRTPQNQPCASAVPHRSQRRSHVRKTIWVRPSPNPSKCQNLSSAISTSSCIDGQSRIFSKLAKVNPAQSTAVIADQNSAHQGSRQNTCLRHRLKTRDTMLRSPPNSNAFAGRGRPYACDQRFTNPANIGASIPATPGPIPERLATPNGCCPSMLSVVSNNPDVSI